MISGCVVVLFGMVLAVGVIIVDYIGQVQSKIQESHGPAQNIVTGLVRSLEYRMEYRMEYRTECEVEP
jgi:hypothetical protein